MSETPDNPPAAAENPDFEAALEELETLVERLESGELSLEDSLRAYERGVVLTRHCQDALRTAEQRVSILAGDGETQSPGELTDMPPPDPA